MSEDQTKLRIKHAIQCPECFGVWLITVLPRQPHDPKRFQCEECGCIWRTE